MAYGKNHTVELWDVDAEKLIEEPLKGHDCNVNRVAFQLACSDQLDLLLASVSDDNMVILWGPTVLISNVTVFIDVDVDDNQSEAFIKPLRIIPSNPIGYFQGHFTPDEVYQNNSYAVILWNAKTFPNFGFAFTHDGKFQGGHLDL